MPTRTRLHNTTVIGIVLAVGLAILAIALFVPKQKNTTTAYPVVLNSPTAEAGLILPLVQLEGQWFSRDDDLAFTGTVTGQEIEIQVSFSGETSALYWHGSFKPAESPGAQIASDRIELRDEIVLGQSASKNFEIKQDAIVFDFSAMGFTKKVTMTRG
jgi:hypothetical protein